MISRVKICSEISDFVCFVSDVMEKSSSQYDSFLFWRQPIPALDLSELEDLGLIDCEAANSGKGREKKTLEVWSCDEEVRLKQVTHENVPLSRFFPNHYLGKICDKTLKSLTAVIKVLQA